MDNQKYTHQTQWYAYLHANYSIQLKRLFDVQYKQDCAESPYCLKWTEPFCATNREEAMHIAIGLLEENKCTSKPFKRNTSTTCKADLPPVVSRVSRKNGRRGITGCQIG